MMVSLQTQKMVFSADLKQATCVWLNFARSVINSFGVKWSLTKVTVA